MFVILNDLINESQARQLMGSDSDRSVVFRDNKMMVRGCSLEITLNF